MIRRSTWVVFGIFVLVAVLVFFLTKTPNAPFSGSQTPEPTAVPRMIEGWTSEEITKATLIRAIGGTTELIRQGDGQWLNQGVGNVSAGKVEQLLSELLATRILAELPADYSLESLYLVNPGQMIILEAETGKKLEIRVGGLTPTGNGYYVKVQDHAPIVVSRYAIEAVFQGFDAALPETPTPPGITPVIP